MQETELSPNIRRKTRHVANVSKPPFETDVFLLTISDSTKAFNPSPGV